MPNNDSAVGGQPPEPNRSSLADHLARLGVPFERRSLPIGVDFLWLLPLPPPIEGDTGGGGGGIQQPKQRQRQEMVLDWMVERKTSFQQLWVGGYWSVFPVGQIIVYFHSWLARYRYE